MKERTSITATMALRSSAISMERFAKTMDSILFGLAKLGLDW